MDDQKGLGEAMQAHRIETKVETGHANHERRLQALERAFARVDKSFAELQERAAAAAIVSNVPIERVATRASMSDDPPDFDAPRRHPVYGPAAYRPKLQIMSQVARLRGLTSPDSFLRDRAMSAKAFGVAKEHDRLMVVIDAIDDACTKILDDLKRMGDDK